MAGFLGWLKSNWFHLIEAFSLISGFIFAAKAWRIQFLAALKEKHQGTWEKFIGNLTLQRIFSWEADLSSKPMTSDEEIALNIILIQYETGWEAARFLDRKRLVSLSNDVSRFFRRPLVHAAWEKYKSSHDERFIKFVTLATENGRKNQTEKERDSRN